MESNTIMVLIAVAYGAFLGYCFGRYQGHAKSANFIARIYRK